jgi:4-hydroxy-tetrahydrodipicolinate synthase
MRTEYTRSAVSESPFCGQQYPAGGVRLHYNRGMREGLFKGIVPAVVTPFRADERIDYEVWQEIVEALIASGVGGLLWLGGQGEFYALTEEEREVAARFAVQTSGGRVPVYVNVGSNSTQESVRLAQQAETDGIDCAVVITPYYVQPSDDELVDHYAAICHSVRIPVLAYNIPQRTRVTLTPAILGRVAAVSENFAGLKDSSGKVEDIEGYIGAGLKVLIGLDWLVLEGLKRGCTGVAVAGANIAPRAFVELYDAFCAGDLARAERMQALIDPLREAFGLGSFSAMVKEALEIVGMGAGPCRRPVGHLPAGARAKLSQILDGLRAEGYLLAAPSHVAEH